jgi:hypothetical protein
MLPLPLGRIVATVLPFGPVPNSTLPPAGTGAPPATTAVADPVPNAMTAVELYTSTESASVIVAETLAVPPESVTVVWFGVKGATDPVLIASNFPELVPSSSRRAARS